MAMTLLEAAKVAPDLETGTIIEEYAASSDILQEIPFRDIDGSGEHYNREDTLPGIGFRGINEGYESSNGIINPQSEALKHAGGELDVDRAIVDQQGEAARASHELMKVKALALAWTRNFIKGDSRTNPRVFDGLQVRVTGSQLIENTAAGGPLSLIKLDEVIDQVDGATHLAMSKSMRRLLTAAARDPQVSGHINYEQNQFGQKVMYYQGLRILILDYDNTGADIMPWNEASGDSSALDCSSIYCLSFGEMMVSGIQGKVNGRYGIQVKDMGELQEKPAFRTRVEWDNAITVKHGRSVARLRGIKNAPVVA
ncbi:hypothetical protein H6G00_00770 [Leptolyngbya sp. FACHB-541]|uniref:major capsid protein n=1 Tax=Leptolyngbya sp. FACHB-541 TaxID=2692810 RepID=UPI0016851EDE|nr:hypothetical protein [Leptolyngbya sp. FACHB-541]MBD1995160.1 hypothetical protein [Leptolyngbya sp. FACHB-541]